MNYLITGASGFVGKHLANYLRTTDPSAKVFGVSRRNCPELAELGVAKQFECDLGNKDHIIEILKSTSPNFIVHLASQSSVAQSWVDPSESFKNNTNIFLNLLEAIRIGNFKDTTLLSVGSSDQYGSSGRNFSPLRECDPQLPLSPYAVARVAQEQLAQLYQKGFGLKIICTRSFNHMGPGQTDKFVISSFVKQAVKIKLGLEKELRCGDLNVVRDFMDVRDVVRAYDLLLKKGIDGGVYNVCSGKGHSLEQIVNAIKKAVGTDFNVNQNQNLMRPIETPYIIGSYFQLNKDTGFEPQFSLEDSLKDIQSYWLKELS